jgi:beta-glucosidase
MKRAIRKSLAASGMLVAPFMLLAPTAAADPKDPMAAASDPWMNPHLPIDKRVDALMAAMTLDDKIALLHGVYGSPYVGYVPANPRLHIPALYLEDGPAGVADGMNGVTQFPAPIAVSASWDTNLAKQYGAAIGQEEKGKGVNIALAPDVNIMRVPQGGRTFESFGEDPYLNGAIAAADIEGIQSQGVMATVKHYDANNQELNRGTVSANIDERTLHEIYLPAFEDAVKQAHVAAVMAAYNKVNGTYCSENEYLLKDVLKGEWRFPGFVMSDWGATHSTVQAANAGLDMEMPTGNYFGANLKQAVEDGQVSMATIDDKVRRILYEMFRFGLFDNAPTGSPNAVVTSTEHEILAKKVAEEGTVLLKNEGNLLPLDPKKVKSIAVIGPDAGDAAMTSGGGSSHVNPSRVVTPLEGITARAGNGVKVTYAQGIPNPIGTLPTIPAEYLTPFSGVGHGLTVEYYNNTSLSGTPVATGTDTDMNFHWNGLSPASGVPATNWSARWTGTLTPPETGTYTFSLTSDDGSRLYINGQLVIDNWRNQAAHTETATVDLTAGKPVQITVEYYQAGGDSLLQLGWQPPNSSLLDEAVQIAKQADVAIVFANDYESEGMDRSNLALPGEQDQLIEAVAAANPHTVVVLNTGGPVLMPWIDKVAGIIEAWYPGQEDGDAIAAVLFGDVNPSGHLPMTFPMSETQVPANTPQQYPGINNVAVYSEGLDVGYRWYDANNVTPLFPFGYGLSYTDFRYSHLRIEPKNSEDGKIEVLVQVDVTNIGKRAGAAVPQLYVADPQSAGEPPKQLKGFAKVFLQPGQTERVTFTLDSRAFSVWDTQRHDWVVPGGTYHIMIGSSVDDIHLSGQVTIPSDVKR